MNQKWNNDKCKCEGKNPKKQCLQKKFICNPATCSCGNGKYVGSIIGNSVIACDEITEERNFNDKKINCKAKKFYISLAFLLITIALLIDVRIYCYFIKNQAKQKHLLPFYNTINELK